MQQLISHYFLKIYNMCILLQTTDLKDADPPTMPESAISHVKHFIVQTF